MGERKVLNKYYPPDFDPADVPRGKREKDNAMKVRMMLPMTVRCSTCGEFMYKGTKFNCKKEDVQGSTYLGIQIFRFYMRCRKCSAEITYTTNPKTMDYDVEHGASRNFEQWKAEQTVEEAVLSKRVNEDEDRVKKLENKTADSKREMDVIETLDDLLHTQGQHETISTEAALAAIRARANADLPPGEQANTGDWTAEDDAVVRQMVAGGAFVQRVNDYDDYVAPKAANLTAAQPTRKVPQRSVVKRPNPVIRRAQIPDDPDTMPPLKKQHAGSAQQHTVDIRQSTNSPPKTVATAQATALFGGYDNSSNDEDCDG